MPAIERLLPEAHFIHIIRDGRDVALSLRGLPFSPGDDMRTLAAFWRGTLETARRHGSRCTHYCEVRYECLIAEPRAVLSALCDFVALPWDPNLLRYFENAPARLEEHGDRRSIDGRVVIPRAQRLRQQALTLLPPLQSRVYAWKKAMTSSEREEFEGVAGPLLRALEYEI